MNSQSPGQEVLPILNYATPLILLAYYIASTIFAFCTLRYGDGKPLSPRRHACFVCLSFVITACYAAQAIQYIPHLHAAPDHGLIHALSQLLLWISLSLISLVTTVPTIFIYGGLSALNLLLETAICVLTLIDRSPAALPPTFVSLVSLQISICVVLTVYTALLMFTPLHNRDQNGSDEARSLLGKRVDSSSSSTTSVANYDALSQEEEHFSESEEESDPDSDEEDEETKELKETQRRRLQEQGGWIGYLKAFKVFVPLVLPKNDIRYQLYVALLLFNTIVQRGLNVLHPWQLGIIIDTLTTQRVIPWRNIFLWMFFEFAASNSCGVGAVNEMLENRLDVWSRQKLSVASFEHVMGLSMTFHDQKDSGEIIKAIEQAGSLSSLVRLLIIDIAPGGLDTLIAMWYVTYLFDVYALLIVVSVGIAFVAVTYGMTTFMTGARRAASTKERDQSKVVYESISNWFTISYFNRSSYTSSRLSRVVGDSAVATMRSNDLYTYIYALQEICEKLGRLAITVLAAHRIVSGTSTVGNFVALESYWDTITYPLYILGHSYRQLNTDLVDAERLLQLFQQKPSVVDRSDAQKITTAKGEVVFDHVGFAYEGRKSTLTDFNITAKPGQTIALVGETGSGKSTALKLLMRFYDVTAGRITIDGHDIRDWTLASLREVFGFVPQDTVLFNMTILENVRYGRLDATDAEVHAACRAASIHDKILSFPSGYASKVGERGVKLSGGERQRIAIARVFLKDPQIVLLDEATSAMDSQTEAKIQSSLRALMKGRTAFVIAHRLSTIVEADLILVVDEGKVVESGSHSELLMLNGVYMGLWTKQAALATSKIDE